MDEEEYYQNENHCTSKFSTLRLFSEIRWTVRAKALKSIYENYKGLEELWDWCLDEYKIQKQRHGFMVYSLRCKRLSIFLHGDLLFLSLGIVITLKNPKNRPYVMRNLSSFGKTRKIKHPSQSIYRFSKVTEEKESTS